MDQIIRFKSWLPYQSTQEQWQHVTGIAIKQSFSKIWIPISVPFQINSHAPSLMEICNQPYSVKISFSFSVQQATSIEVAVDLVNQTGLKTKSSWTITTIIMMSLKYQFQMSSKGLRNWNGNVQIKRGLSLLWFEFCAYSPVPLRSDVLEGHNQKPDLCSPLSVSLSGAPSSLSKKDRDLPAQEEGRVSQGWSLEWGQSSPGQTDS